tara:strand:+ start:251 stop:1252 length:1002 start_codon:yes stop_codon:yes gene_type:complete
MSAKQEVTTNAARIPSIRDIVIQARPKQMLKNGLVLVPLFFTVNIWYNSSDLSGMSSIITRALAALGIFILISAAVYFINDSADAKKDRIHPQKRFRPIAAKRISVPWAVGIATLMIIGGLSSAYLISVPLLITTTSYLSINIAYSWWIKNIILLDVMIVASGFVLRAVAGSIAIDHAIIESPGGNIPLDLTISPWLYVVTALGALLITLAKRRQELRDGGKNSKYQRLTLNEYNLPLLDSLINVVATATLISYTLYTFSTGVTEVNVPNNHSMMLTIPFVAYGIMRYLYLVHIKELGENPEEILFKDRPLMLNILFWLVTGSSVLMWTRLSE